jgi:hypothetical protein
MNTQEKFTYNLTGKPNGIGTLGSSFPMPLGQGAHQDSRVDDDPLECPKPDKEDHQ